MCKLDFKKNSKTEENVSNSEHLELKHDKGELVYVNQI